MLDVIVGITPACPYGLSACWGGAEQGLSRMTGVDSVSRKPDATNSLAEVKLKANTLPDIANWSDQFHAIVGQVYAYRGVEVVVRGELFRQASGDLSLRVSGVDSPLWLTPLKHKLQWNYQLAKPRTIQPEEAAAFAKLKTLADERSAHSQMVCVTGPLTVSADRHFVLEVRAVALDDSRRPATAPSATTMPTIAVH